MERDDIAGEQLSPVQEEQGSAEGRPSLNGQVPPEEPAAEAVRPPSEPEGVAGEADQSAPDRSGEGEGNIDPAALEEVRRVLEGISRLQELERELSSWKERYGRLQADFESYRFRMGNEVDAAHGAGVAKAAEQLLPVLDDLRRAIGIGSEHPEQLIAGLRGVESALLSRLEALGLQVTGKVGEPFDPELHEALSVVQGEEDNTIVQVYQQGALLAGRLIRPARVVVSKR